MMISILQGWRRNSTPRNCGVHWWKHSETQDTSQAHLRQGWWCLKWSVGFVWVCTHTNIVYTFHPKYVPSMYYFHRVRTGYTLVCTVFTKILQWMLFDVVCLWETILSSAKWGVHILHIKFWLTYFAYLLHILHILG